VSVSAWAVLSSVRLVSGRLARRGVQAVLPSEDRIPIAQFVSFLRSLNQTVQAYYGVCFVARRWR